MKTIRDDEGRIIRAEVRYSKDAVSLRVELHEGQGDHWMTRVVWLSREEVLAFAAMVEGAQVPR